MLVQTPGLFLALKNITPSRKSFCRLQESTYLRKYSHENIIFATAPIARPIISSPNDERREKDILFDGLWPYPYRYIDLS